MDSTITALLEAIRTFAAAVGQPELAHLATAGLNGDSSAAARIIAGLALIDTSPTTDGAAPRAIQI